MPESDVEGDAVDGNLDAGDGVVNDDGFEAVVPVPKGVTPPAAIPAARVTGGAGNRVPEKVAIVDGKVPRLPRQDREQRQALKGTVGIALSGSGEAKFLEGLREPAADPLIFAAHNTALMVFEILDSIVDLLDEDTEIGSLVASIRDGLNLQLPAPPATITLQDILNIQAASNLANSLSALLTLAAGADVDIDELVLGEADITDPAIRQAVLDVISDASFFVRIARAQGATSAILNSININGLLDMLGGDDGAAGERSPGIPPLPDDPQTVTLGDSAEYLNGFRGTFDLILRDILGVSKNTEGVYVMDAVKFKRAIDSYRIQSGSFNSFLMGVRVANLGYADISADDRAVFCGLTGLMNYTLATVLINVEPVVEELGSSLPVGFRTIKQITDAFLLPNGALLDKDPLEASDTIVIPTELETISDSFNDPAAILSELDLETEAETFVNNAILLMSLGQSSDNGNLILDMLNELKDEMDKE